MAVVFFDQGAGERIAQEMGIPAPDLPAPVDVYGLSEFERPTIGAGVAAAGGAERSRDELRLLQAATRAAQTSVRSVTEAA